MNYREMLGSEPQSGGAYRFILTADFSVRVPALARHTETISFRDNRGQEWARITGDVLTVSAGYAWNGATPKWWIGWPIKKWFGTPDPLPTRRGTLVHDVCFQFIRTQHFPLTFSECNTLFHILMVEDGFRWANLYHGAVRDFGARFAGEFPRRGEHSVLLIG